MHTNGRSSLAIARCLAALAFTLVLGAPAVGTAQEKPKTPPDPAKVLAAAREVMEAQQYCALITMDAGMPQIRTMNPFVPDESMVVWMATHTSSRKVGQIKKDPRVSLYYADHANAIGYVQVIGRAVLVDDRKEILKRKRAYWDQAFPGLENLTLIKVIPERIEVINYRQGIVASRETGHAPSVEMPKK